MKVKELLKEAAANCGDYASELIDCCESSYICDAISEIGDSNTSIYYSDIENYIVGNISGVEDAIREFGWCGDLHQAGQQAEYLEITNDIYRHLDEGLYHYALNWVFLEGINEITEEQADELRDAFDDYDHNNQLWDVIEITKEILNMEERDEENNK